MLFYHTTSQMSGRIMNCTTLIIKAMTSSHQPKEYAARSKTITTKIKMLSSRSRLLHPSTRTCQGVLSVAWLMISGFRIAVTLPQCHRIYPRTRPTTPARKKPIIHPKSPGPRFSPIQASFSEIKRGLVPHKGPMRCTQSLDNFPQRCYNYLI
jgi:hypothetical protein